ncbi:MAG: PEGA domain-containing protein, partial [Deltaproteobacteria bacterium]|nr:PEGA domain-containing protein [Deltaproteobacteria bacterium]
QLDATTDPEAHVDAKAAARAAQAVHGDDKVAARAAEVDDGDDKVAARAAEVDDGDPDSHSMTIESTPEGATVTLGAEVLGVTPILANNPVREGESRQLTLTLRGHRRWTTTVRGGVDARVSATLVKAP